MHEQVVLAEPQARQIMRMAGISGPVRVTEIRRHNHVYRLECSDGAFFLKCFTKDWYAGDPEAPRWCVAHEKSAWDCLAAHGLAAPDIVMAASDADNPVGRPFLLTRQLPGRPLTDDLKQPRDVHELLVATGSYLAAMHAITFAYPGYVIGDGPTTPPPDDSWQHRCWTARERQRSSLAMLRADGPHLSRALVRRLEVLFAGTEQELSPDYDPPHFLAGDCHAHHFYLARETGTWRITGVIDMEVASAGDAVEDLLKFCIEMAATLPGATRWWESLFAGYGQTPDFGRFRLRLLGASEGEFRWLGSRGWPGSREETLTSILAAKSWEELFAGRAP